MLSGRLKLVAEGKFDTIPMVYVIRITVNVWHDGFDKRLHDFDSGEVASGKMSPRQGMPRSHAKKAEADERALVCVSLTPRVYIWHG